MLKNIYIHISNFAANFALRRFCRQHKTLLAENNIHYITLQDLFPELPAFSQTPFLDNALYVHQRDKDRNPQITFPTDQELTAQLQKFTQEHHIENIILIFQGITLSDYLSSLLLLKKTFPDAQFHVEENTVILERELECIYNFTNLYIQNSISVTCNNYYEFNYLNSLTIKNCYTLPSSPLAALFKTTISQHIFSNEIDCLQQFLSFIHVPCKNSYFYPNTFHPQVLAFLIALREYLFTDKVFDFYSEYDFLNYKQRENHLFTYALENEKNEVSHYAKTPVPPITKTTITYVTCKDSSLRIDFESACELAERITPAMRQFILKDIDEEYFLYCPHTNKIVYAALMLAEHTIDLEKAKKLLQKTKGRINTTIEKYSKNPILTIYTPTYNQKDYIKQCIESILAQKTKYPFKHLIIDDASTDGTQEILKEYAKKYEHIELIIHKKNKMMVALSHFPFNITTKYAAWCDGDDFYIDEHKLEEQIELLENNPDYGLCFHRTYLLYEEDHCIKQIHPQDSMLPNGIQNYYLPQDIIITNLLQSSSVMYRWLYHDTISSNFAFPVVPYDWALNILHAHKNKIGFINKPMSIYRRHKKAIYYETEHSVTTHIIRYCINEIKFCTAIDKMTNYQYHTLFLKKMAMILDTFYNDIDTVDFDREQYNITKERLEKQFPHVIQEIKNYLCNTARV